MSIISTSRKRKIKQLLRYFGLYSILMAIIYGLRYFHNMGMDWNYYVKITIVMFSFITVFSFLEPKHLEKILPKNSRIAMIVTLIWRFLPVVGIKISNIKHNQEMRGVKYRGFGQIKHNLSILLPAMIVTLIWSNNITESIKMRGAS